MTKQSTAQNSTQGDKAGGDIKRHPKWMAPVLWAVGLFLFFGLGWLLIWFCRHLDPPKDTEIGIPAVLVYVTIWAVVAQILVSRMQWKAMQEGLKQNERMADAASGALEHARSSMVPRLRITGVTTENFAVGRKPVFLVEIVNDGMTDAKNVTVHIRSDTSLDRSSAKWSREQIIDIPANDKRRYPAQWKEVITNDQMNALNDSIATLKVSGSFKLPNEEPVGFCYKYFPWRGLRPEGLDQFFPCDFDPGLTVLVKAKGEILAAGEVSKTVGKPLASEIKPSGGVTFQVTRGKSADEDANTDD